MKQNDDIRQLLASKHIKQWELAHQLGVCETTLIRWLRAELPEEKRNSMIEAINQIVKGEI